MTVNDDCGIIYPHHALAHIVIQLNICVPCVDHLWSGGGGGGVVYWNCSSLIACIVLQIDLFCIT